MFITPHGTNSIKELNYKKPAIKTRQSFAYLKNIINQKDIDHLVVVDPHELINNMSFTIFNALRYSGSWSYRSKRVASNYSTDNKINNVLINKNKNIFRVVNERHHKLSWGSFVPLWHLRDNQTISVISVDSKIPTKTIKRIGYNIYRSLNDLNKNIAIIFSCDLSHAHSKTSKRFPYSTNSITYDKHVQEVIDKQMLEHYNTISPKVVASAHTDAHAQLTMLSGICENINYTSKLHSYEVPTYFGMSTGSIHVNI